MMATALAQISVRAKEKSPIKALDQTERPGHSLEEELILICSRARLTPEQIDRASFILSLLPNWQYIFGVANRNGVMPIISKNLTEHFSFSIDPEIFDQINEFFAEHTARNIFVTAKLLEVIKMLDAAGIASLPFKGPTLAMRSYKNIALRHFVDLDLMVKPNDFDRALKLFLDRGYKIFGEFDPKTINSVLISRKKDIGLEGPDGGVKVELHWKLSGSFFTLPLQLKSLWNRLEKMTLGGYELNTLSFNDLFVYLCLHGARHGFERLNWICDLCELIQTEESIDWAAVKDHARTYGCGKTLELGLLLTRDLFGIEVGYPGWDQVENDTLLKKAVAQIREKIFAEKFNTTEIGDWYLYHLMLKEKRTDRLKLHLHYLHWYLKLLLKPSLVDRSVFRLPPPFYPLYLILRPARLLFNYLVNK